MYKYGISGQSPIQEILFGQQIVHWLPITFSNMNYHFILVILRSHCKKTRDSHPKALGNQAVGPGTRGGVGYVWVYYSISL